MPLKTSDDTSGPRSERNDLGGLVQSADLETVSSKPQRAIRDIGQALEILTTLIASNRNRQIINSRIMAKYNAERPYDSAKLKDEGLGWRSNFTTKPLPQMIEKVAPRFEEAVASVKYLTNSALSNKWQNSVEKTEVFRELVTKTIRSRKGWDTLVSDIALDNALFGYTAVAWLDEFSAFPIHFAQDESFFPDGCKQSSEKAQVGVLKEVYLPHELYDYIKDSEAAESVGWNLKNTIKAINDASPAQLREQLTGAGTTEAWYQNAQRELTVGSSYMAGASVINVYSILVREVTGKISHYRFAGDGSKEKTALIFEKEDRFSSMSDCLAFFTFQKGNKKLHGSKGIGRDIYELAGMQDRMRNEIVDRGILSGKMLVQGDMKMLHKFKMSVVGAMVIVPTGWTFIEQKIDSAIDGFLKLDAYFTQLVDQLIGSVSPRTFQGDRVTKAEVDLFAQREEEGKDTRISRFLRQFTDMVSTVQRRLCDPNNDEPEAKELQKLLLEKMSREEIEELSKQPVASTVRDWTPLQRQMVAAICAEKRGNPLYNQRALEVEDLSARVGSEFTQRVLLPENDPTETAEQQRTQLLELALLTSGQPVPVSPRDNHLLHIQTVMPVAEQVGEQILQGNANTTAFEAVIQHLSDHYLHAQQSGVKSEELKAVKSLIDKAGPIIAKLKDLDQQAQEMATEAQDLQAV